MGILGNGRGILKIIGETAAGMLIAWIIGVVSKRMVPLLLVGVGVFLCLFFWRFLRRTLSLAWGILDPGNGSNELLRFGFDAEGRIKLESVPHRKIVNAQFVRPWKADNASRSLAVATNGVMLASLTEDTLSISKFNARNSTVREWGRLPIDTTTLQNPRVVAVGPKGDGDAWLAIVNGDGYLLWGSYSDLRRGGDWRYLGDPPNCRRATHAAFFGDRLLYDSETVRDLFPSGSLDRYLDGDTVIALDAAKVGGRTYLAVLTGDDTAGSDNCRLIVARIGDSRPPFVHDLRARPTHISMVRSPEGSPDRACVLVDTERSPIFPFLDAAVAGRGRLGLWQRKSAMKVASGGGVP